MVVIEMYCQQEHEELAPHTQEACSTGSVDYYCPPVRQSSSIDVLAPLEYHHCISIA